MTSLLAKWTQGRYDKWVRWLPVVTVMIGLWALPREASAFCRTTTNADFVWTTAKPCDDVGIPIAWPGACVSMVVANGSSQVDVATARSVLQQELDLWTKAADCSVCGGMPSGHPSVTVTVGDTGGCAKAEYNQDSGNANVVSFFDTGWPHDGNVLALTTVTYSKSSGQIFDADIEVNSGPTIPLTVGDPTGKKVYDLLSILAHETGHVLGLAHTQAANTDATMYAKYQEGQSFMRTPAPDDICGVCNIYPVGRTATCDPTPHGGYSELCGGGGATTTSGGGCHCSVGVGDDRAPEAVGSSLVVTLLGAVFARRAVRRSPRRS